jgi:hypothetical protein
MIMKTRTSDASIAENRTRSSTPACDRPQDSTVLTERELDMVAGGGGKKGGTPEFRQ